MKVSFQIDPLGEVVRLTVMESCDGRSVARAGGAAGPVILCGPKSLLETGRPLLPFDMSA